MPRFIRNTAVLAKIEAAYGEDAVPTGAANPVLVSNMSINPLEAQNVPRDLVLPYFGASEELVGVSTVSCQFDVELAGSGTPGTAPAWGPLLRGCAYQEIDGASIVEYRPRTTGQEALTIYYYDDGVLHKLLGSRGSFELKATVGTKPGFTFSFIGLDGIPVAALPGALTLTPWKVPKVVTDANSPGILLEGEYAAGVLSGGTAYTSQGIEVSSGNEATHTPLLGDDSVDVVDRQMGAKFMLDLTAAQEVAFLADVRQNVTRSLAFTHGTEAGNTIVLFAPKVQLINPSKGEVNKRRLIGFDARLIPVNGNDELTICVK